MLLYGHNAELAYRHIKPLTIIIMVQIKFIDLGIKDYKETWDLQEELLSKVLAARNDPAQSDFGGYLLFVEHPHVYTLGKSGEANNLLISEPFLKQINATYYRINRGGDITYHGPGQLVGYPIFDLEKFRLGARSYIEKIEQSITQSLNEYQLEAGPLQGATGVWLDAETTKARKICAIGVRISRSITMHGFALNANTDLTYFSYINPCGFQDKGVTSIEKELQAKPDFEGVKNVVKGEIEEVFDISFASPPALLLK